MFGSFGFMELTLILVIVIIIFGAGRLPQLGEGLGKAIKGFKKSVNEPDAVDITPQSNAQDGPGAASLQIPPPDASPASMNTQTGAVSPHAGSPSEAPQPQT